MKRKDAKIIEYEDAPSGHVTFYQYKEPLMPIENGFGYDGVVLFDGASGKIQCSLCGNWYHALGNHLHKEHNMNASQYKDAVGLNQSTALVSEQTRALLIQKSLNAKRMNNLRPGVSKSSEERKRISETLKKNTSEMKNLRGTCPAQLIDRLQKLAKEKGRTPTQREIPFYATLCKVYGGMRRACELAGLDYREVGSPVSKATKEDLKNSIRGHLDAYGKFPENLRDAKKLKYCSQLNSKSFREMCKEIVVDKRTYIPLGRKVHFSEEELLDFLRAFKEINGRDPSPSDCRRKLLPDTSRYYSKFGSWVKAKELAFS